MTVIYDKLAFMRRLEQDGTFSRTQAEALSEAVHGAMSESVATKSDMTEIRHEMIHMEERLASQMALLRSDLKIWMGSVAAGLFAGLFTALGGLMAVFKFLIH